MFYLYYSGLCGAVHSSVARFIKREIEADGENVKVVCVGDKSRAVLHRQYGNNIILVANEVGRLPPTFTDASKLTNAILTSGYDFNSGKIIYNRFKSVVSYATQEMPVFSQKAVTVGLKKWYHYYCSLSLCF